MSSPRPTVAAVTGRALKYLIYVLSSVQRCNSGPWPSDGEITFAHHVGRLISELAEALMASRSAIASAVSTPGLLRRFRAAEERMARVRNDMSSSKALGSDVSEYRELADLAREAGCSWQASRPNEGPRCWDGPPSPTLVGRMPLWTRNGSSSRGSGDGEGDETEGANGVCRCVSSHAG